MLQFNRCSHQTRCSPIPKWCTTGPTKGIEHVKGPQHRGNLWFAFKLSNHSHLWLVFLLDILQSIALNKLDDGPNWISHLRDLFGPRILPFDGWLKQQADNSWVRLKNTANHNYLSYNRNIQYPLKCIYSDMSIQYVDMSLLTLFIY